MVRVTLAKPRPSGRRPAKVTKPSASVLSSQSPSSPAVKWPIRPADHPVAAPAAAPTTGYAIATKTSLKWAMFGSSDSYTGSASGKKDTPVTVGGPGPDSTTEHSLPPEDMIPGLMQKKNFADEEMTRGPRT